MTTRSAPPPLPPEGLRIIPLGGLGEIGRNMAVLEFAGRILIIDCGVLFPEDHQPGIDVVLPDFSILADRWDDVDGVFLTHGHEDHIGGVPYLIQAGLRAPIFGSRLTLGFLHAKLRGRHAETREVVEGEVLDIGEFRCQFIAVNHSIPDALAVAVTTNAGTVVHTGDFKADPTPLDRRLTDMAAFHELGRSGVALLMSDSTNAEVRGFVATELDIGNVLTGVVSRAPGRVFVACTSSHIHRIQHVLDAAAATGRKVALVGASIQRNFKVAEDLGFLRFDPKVLATGSETLSPERLVVLCTGSQGEPAAALSRMAHGQHPDFELGPGDTAVFASSLIPGNEEAVYRIINRLAYFDVDTVTKEHAKVHVSGHAAAGELTQVLNAVRPANFLPVHGEGRHLRAHSHLAHLTGVPKERTFVVHDGDVIDLVDGVATVTGHVQAGFTYVDGVGVGEVGEESLRDRRILRDEGFISVVAVVDSATGDIVSGPEVSARGFADDDEPLQDIRSRVGEAIRATAETSSEVDIDELRRAIKRAVGSRVSRFYRRRPMLLVYVVAV